MGHLLKVLTDVAAYTLGGRCGVVPLGMAGLQRRQFPQHGVKFLIGYFGLALYIIQIVMTVQRLAQRIYSRFIIHDLFLFLSLLFLYSWGANIRIIS